MYIDTNAVSIYLEDTGAGEPLILIHGLGMSSALWVHQQPEFATRFRTLAVDLRGFGKSDKPATPGAYAIEMLARDIAEVADTLALGPYHVLGTSMGGFVAQALALDRPDLCCSLVLCHTGPRMSIPADILQQRLSALSKSPMEAYAPLVVEQALAGGADQALRQWVFDMVVNNDKRAYTQVLMEGLADFDVTDRVAAIGIPTLVVIGAQDRVIPPTEGRELARLISGARLVEIEDVGHLSYAERPDVFNTAVLNFLEAL